ncbi:MAG: PQQ-binding-like beta-propeller repeat protein [Planctomycetota bacterium]
MRTFVKPILCVAAIGVAWMPGALCRADDWPHLGLDNGRTRASAEISGNTFAGGAWSYTVPGAKVVSSPAVADGYVVFGAGDGKVRVLGEDGTFIREFTTGDGVDASPAVSGGVLYVPSRDGKLYSRRLANGTVPWTPATLGGQEYSSPVVRDGMVYLGSGFPNKKALAVNTTSGAPAWETPAGAVTDIIYSSPALSDAFAIFGATGGRYYKTTLATGATTPFFTTDGIVNLSSPLIAGDRVYFMPGENDRKLYAADLATGNAIAGFPIVIPDPAGNPAGTVKNTHYAVSSPVAAAGRVIFQIRMDYHVDTDASGSADQYVLREYVVSVNPAGPAVTGQKAVGTLTTTNINDIPELYLCPTPAAFARDGGGTLLAVSSTVEAKLRILDAADVSSELWSAALSAPGRSSPVFANGRIFVGTEAGILHAFLSSANRPPQAPLAGFFPADGATIEDPPPAITWTPSTDPDGDNPSAIVRIDTDGEVLEDWLYEIPVAAGDASAAPPTALNRGEPYTYAIRSRDAKGAWSAWSAPRSFLVDTHPLAPSNLSATAGDGSVALAWTASPPSGVVTYLLHYTDGTSSTDPLSLGNITSTIVADLSNWTTYTFSLIARDADGDESAAVTIQATPVPLIQIGNTRYPTVEAALDAASSGSVVTLGAGTFALSASAVLRPGIALAGVNPRDTVIDAKGLAEGIRIAPSSGAPPLAAAPAPPEIRFVTITGAATGVRVTGVADAVLRNVVLRDNTTAGLAVDAGASASLINATVTGNATGARSAGRLSVRNGHIFANETGLAAAAGGTVASTYNNLYGNTIRDYDGTAAGSGDIARDVLFLSPVTKDFREQENQPIIDAGDPADNFSLEPDPNGGRINIGAYGNTPMAQKSPPSSLPPPATEPPIPGTSGGGGGCFLKSLHKPASGGL